MSGCNGSGGLGVSVGWWRCEVVGGGRGGVRVSLVGVGLNVEASTLTGGVCIEGVGPTTTPGCGLCVCVCGEGVIG